MKSVHLPEALIYPRYEVTIPSLPDETIFVTSFTVKDLIELSSVINFTESKLVEYLLSMIYKKIVDKDKLGVSSQEEFYKKYYIPDRDALLLGIITATYNTEFNMSVRCSSCGTTNKFKTDIMKHVVFNKDVFKPNFSKEIYLERTKVYVNLSYPTIAETVDTVKKLDMKGFRNKDEKDAFTNLVGGIVPFVKSLKIMKADGSSVAIETTDKSDIADFISVLPKNDYDLIVDEISNENISKPYITFNYRYICFNCGSSNTATGDVNDLFFRMIYS